MLSNRLAFGALATACIAAAAGGGYLATRQNVVPTPAAAASVESAPNASASAVPAHSTPAGGALAVQETEAVVGDTPPAASAPISAPPKAAAPSRPSIAAPAPRSRAARTDATAPQVARQETPALANSWPRAGTPEQVGSAAPAPSPNGAEEQTAPRSEGEPGTSPVRAIDESAPTFDELVLAADSVIGLQLDSTLSSENARIEDRVEAHVTRAVRVNERVAIPAGTKAIGAVTLVEKGGKFKEQARLGIRFHTLVLDDGTQLPVGTDAIYRVGEAPNSAQKVGGAAVGGAILGAILGGGKGAVLGGLAGAGGGAAVTMAGDRNAATMSAGTPLTIRINAPLTVTVDKES